ncbi:MAG: hypothetical protein M3Q96_04555 [Pseudomonadota bacterium]|nr:hypothetical protein [Pseudomonadota bacterium]MDQ3057004.1 hypothetical protein [Pseudomonadota bacterium]MDQ3229555.1 hypothetical protein [Pseudomonadota bacterium]
MVADRLAVAHAGRAAHARNVGRFEQLPKWLNLIPMVLQWLWLGMRHGSVTLPSAANPHITAGGLVGEGKLEYFKLMGPLARAATAEHIGVRIEETTGAEDVIDAMHAAGLRFPIVVKPDLGWCGHGVRKIDDSDALAHYLAFYPTGQMLVLQRYLAEDGEAGLFYMRHRDEVTGRLIGVLLRHYPRVVGNGHDTVAVLIAEDARLKRATGSRLHECQCDPEYVPGTGEKVRLSTIASTRVGGLYEDATAAVTPALTARVDAIARDMPDFHVGRFDVRYSTLDALRAGEFTIMEVNGAGSEAVHAWDPKYTIAQVYGIVFAKQRALFRIADANRRAGHRPIGMRALARLHLAQQKLMARYPPSN